MPNEKEYPFETLMAELERVMAFLGHGKYLRARDNMESIMEILEENREQFEEFV